MDSAQRGSKTVLKEGKKVEEIARKSERLGQWIEGKVIRGTKYNKRYKDITTIEIPKYLRIAGVKASQKIIARQRCGNEEEKNKYWGKDEERRCVICDREVGKSRTHNESCKQRDKRKRYTR